MTRIGLKKGVGPLKEGQHRRLDCSLPTESSEVAMHQLVWVKSTRVSPRLYYSHPPL